MKPTFIAFLALCLFLVGCGTTPKGINQTSKIKIGTPIWEFETGDIVSDPAIGSDGTVYVGSSDNKLYAIKTDSKGLAKSPWPMRGQNAEHTGRA
ncbi:MAG: PQQ-binding-like beta-propeller repeat protein [Pedosphaera sp.]|nr:PQQ-binding-like beta-propeller repeat protein [Pedosphaera sp.]